MNLARIAALLEPFLKGCPTSRGFRGPRHARLSRAGAGDVGPVSPAGPALARWGEGLSPVQLGQISTYIDLLLRWNARINLTAIRTPEEIVTRHFGESFFLARHLFPEPLPTAHRPRPTVLDLGSGAGFPALPLKIWAPHIHLALVESSQRKAAFLREVARALTLTNIDVFAERAETLSARLGPEFPKADVVTFRAVEKFDRILPLAATFLAPTARLALLISTPQFSKLKALPALTWRTLPVPHSHTRILSIGEQVNRW